MVDHERKGFDEEIRSWRAALREVGYLSGWHVHKRVNIACSTSWFKVMVSVTDSECPEAYWSQCICLVSDDT